MSLDNTKPYQLKQSRHFCRHSKYALNLLMFFLLLFCQIIIDELFLLVKQLLYFVYLRFQMYVYIVDQLEGPRQPAYAGGLLSLNHLEIRMNVTLFSRACLPFR